MRFSKRYYRLFLTYEDWVDLLKKSLLKRAYKSGIGINILISDKDVFKAFRDSYCKELSCKSTDFAECFLAFESLYKFYDEDVEIGFEAKSSFKLNESVIDDLDALFSFCRKDTDVDAIVRHPNGVVRDFQFKSFVESPDKLTSENLAEYICEKVSGGYLRVNWLVNLVVHGGSTDEVDFGELSRLIKNYLSGKREVLIIFNENNEFNTMIRVYPDLAMLRVERS